MTSAFAIVKVILAVGFVICGTVALWLAPAMALPLFVGSVAWSQVSA